MNGDFKAITCNSHLINSLASNEKLLSLLASTTTPGRACVSLANEKSIVYMIHFTNFQITFNTKRLLVEKSLDRGSACNQVFSGNDQHGSSIYEAVRET